jgi:hypothetical protein
MGDAKVHKAPGRMQLPLTRGAAHSQNGRRSFVPSDDVRRRLMHLDQVAPTYSRGIDIVSKTSADAGRCILSLKSLLWSLILDALISEHPLVTVATLESLHDTLFLFAGIVIPIRAFRSLQAQFP